MTEIKGTSKHAPRTRVALSRKKRKVFLDVLAKTGNVSFSAQAAGYTTTIFLHKTRREDEDFAEAWDQALQAAGDVVEAEAYRRAIEGVLEPNYYKGDVVGYTPKYSDTLLLAILKKLKPEYREGGRGGDMNINFGIAVLPMTANDESGWEQRAVQMHNGQTLVEIEAKPVENELMKVKRGD